MIATVPSCLRKITIGFRGVAKTAEDEVQHHLSTHRSVPASSADDDYVERVLVRANSLGKLGFFVIQEVAHLCEPWLESSVPDKL